MSSEGLITHSGRQLTARLLLGHQIQGITHCAIGDGDHTFTDPASPPPPTVDQTSLKHERARKRYTKRVFLARDPYGPIIIDGERYAETIQETNTIGLFFQFSDHEVNGIIIREYGFFGGTVAYTNGHQDHLALNGLYDPQANPDGEVAQSGYLYEVKNVPDWPKTPDTTLELIALIRL